MIILGATILGLLLGSFLSVLIERWPQWRGAGAGRSQCPHCSHVLAWYDLIPVVSWALLRGKCRYCHVAISKNYLVLELVMAAVLGGYATLYGIPTGWYAFDYVILFAFVALFFFDVRHQMLPDAIVLPLGALIILRLVFFRPDMLINAVAMGALLAALPGLLYLVSRGRWIGFGDVKLGAAIGLLFGFPVAIGVTLVAVWAGALVGLVLIARRRATMETALPFGAFWVAAAIVAMFAPASVAFLSGLFIPVLL